jgi:GT2 family glycosyltransferase
MTAVTTANSGVIKDDPRTPARLCLAISSYRNDPAVDRILQSVHDGPTRELFETILVVDSQGTGCVPDLIRSRGWNNVQYRSCDVNLGSAGNLAERLRWSKELGMDYVYAINHDGYVDAEIVRAMLDEARRRPKIGAIYPLRFMSGPAKFNVTGTRGVPARAKLIRDLPREEAMPAYWSSSNGALYALGPVREGLLPPADFWMGWEDLDYGLALRDAGYEQVLLRSAQYRDDYEYSRRSGLNVTQKAPWYAYYMSRNLLLTGRRRRLSHPWFLLVLAYRLASEYPLILLLRDRKLQRARLLTLGILDGLRGRTGKGPVP